jgi:hypothetical protein
MSSWHAMSKAVLVALAFAMLGPQKCATSHQYVSYSVDGVTLGSNVRDLLQSRGKPNDSEFGPLYGWRNSAGGKLTVMTDSSGNITVISLHAGSKERRWVLLPSYEGEDYYLLGDTGHANYTQPRETIERPNYDLCGSELKGSPCEAFTLPHGIELVLNFGEDINQGADWALSQVILGNRDYLIQSGIVVTRP